MKANWKKFIGAGLILSGVNAFACSPDSYVGSICTVSFNYCPLDTLEANGQILNISQYAALYSLLGKTYGGDGTKTFGLPDLRGRSIRGSGQGTGLSVLALGDRAGSELVTLSVNQVPLPQHAHAASFTGGVATNLQASGAVTLPISGSVSDVPVTGDFTAHVLSSQSSGGSQTPSTGGNATIGRTSASASPFYSDGATAAASKVNAQNIKATGGTLSGNAVGNVSLPVSGSISPGAVVVAASALMPATAAIDLRNPYMAMKYCIVTQGTYPTRD